jgi:hypothetical protein
VSNFLKNLVKRSAGLPVSARILPPRTFETGFRSGKTPDEVATEETTTSIHDIALAPQSIPISSCFGTHDLQRATVNKTSPPSPAPHTGPISVHVPSTEAGSAPVFQIQPNSASARAVLSHGQRVNEGNELKVQQTVGILRESDFGPANSRSRDNQTQLPAPVVVNRPVSVPGKKDVAPVDHTIRPAPTRQTTSFQFPRVLSAPPQTPATLPIHVRVGRIEIKGNAPQHAPARQAPKEVAPLGFAGYQRLRRYRY